MKSKLEIYLDKEFDKLEIRLHIYHFIEDVLPFNGITVVTETENITWKVIFNFIRACNQYDTYKRNRATELIKNFKMDYEIYGVAICNKRDTFNRQRGRVISKGRLLKHIKEK